ncbi:MAG: nucleoside hydrolase [Clostridiales bacterium]|nr:nucleoside hydrolase [Clostridiales bacterium]
MKRVPVIIDCDPGHDDMMALVIGCCSPELDVRLVTTVAGNKPLELVTKNALNVLNYIGANEVPLAMGCDRPICRPKDHANSKLAEFRRHTGSIENGAHGATGLDGFQFPENNPKEPTDIRAVEAMAEVLRESDEKVTIIPLGPLTNVALLIRCYPNLVDKIDKISMMGGTSQFVFTRQYMEFNTFVDPEATKIVFESGIPIIMYGYDVTYSVLFDESVIRKIEEHKNQTSHMVAELLKTFMYRHNGAFPWLGLTDTCPIHDACAVAGVVDPSLITQSELLHVDVEIGGNYLNGATVVDYAKTTGLPANVQVVYRMDNQRFFDLMERCAANGK